MPIQLSEITSVEERSENVVCLTFSSEPIARKAQPGQFIHIRVQSELDPLLRRPFSIHNVDLRSASVDVLFQIVGAGTRILASKRVGEPIDVLGPLGRGFSSDTERSKAVMVAGGIGVAPFPFLAQRLIESCASVVMLAGWQTGEGVVGIEPVEKLNIPVEIATEDGSRGFKGTVTELLEDRLGKWNQDLERIILYSCGPRAMLARVAHLAGNLNIPCQVSLEERMACGIGACYGCAVRVSGGDDTSPQYKLICRDGPVFDIDEVLFP